MSKLLSAALAAGGLTALSPLAASQNLTTERIAVGLSSPLYCTSPAGDFNRLFVCEQSTARIRIIDLNTNTTLAAPFLDLGPVASGGGERGLLGLAFHPDYMTNGRFFASYTDNGGTSRVVEFNASPPTSNTATATPVATIFSLSQPFSNHNGGCIQFGPNDGMLYIGMGDGGSGGDPGNRAQNLSTNLGKMIRLDVDIAAPHIPPGNPFGDAIWAYGVRNPWRFSFDRANGDMYIADVGQNAIEEVSFQPAASTGGENYGWRCYEGNNPYNTGGCDPMNTMTFPIHTYTHSQGCSITGGYVYRGSALPSLQGTYFFSDYCTSRLWTFRYDGATLTDFMDRTAELDPPNANINSVSSFGEDASGELYIVDSGGEIFKIVEDCTALTSNYCITSPNASGPGATMFSSGSLNVGDNSFLLAMGGGNPFQFGIFFYGTTPDQTPAGNGVLCISSGQGLYRILDIVQMDFIGTGFIDVDFTTPPMNSGAGQIIPSTTYYFQFWYRDPGGPGGTDYNFSDGLMATFCP
ncbi:MAG: PQQ-dependent sugar dehydrogenase [bacterium]|nr:PQQ-dependent sugar dehydrogenase [bacterium]